MLKLDRILSVFKPLLMQLIPLGIQLSNIYLKFKTPLKFCLLCIRMLSASPLPAKLLLIPKLQCPVLQEALITSHQHLKGSLL